jgi:hypothetical protein
MDGFDMSPKWNARVQIVAPEGIVNTASVRGMNEGIHHSKQERRSSFLLCTYS